jgi:hypothetical protein
MCGDLSSIGTDACPEVFCQVLKTRLERGKRSLPKNVGQSAGQNCGFSQNLWCSGKNIFLKQPI